MKRLVLLPTDLSPQSQLAFAYALKFSLNGFLDVVRGSVTGRVGHESSCPLLMIHAN